MTAISKRRTPFITFDYLKRDGDAPMSLWQLASRQLRELTSELMASTRVTSPWDVPALAFWTAAYHAGISFHPIYSRKRARFRMHVDGTPVTIVFRINQSDLYILRENFVQRIYDFDYESQLGDVRTIVDLGANIGLSSLFFQARFPQARIICAEPVAANVEVIRENAAANGFSWAVETVAVTDKLGTVTLYPNEWWSSSSIKKNVAFSREDNVERPENRLRLNCEEVEAVTMPQLFERNGLDTVDILKMDIEGAEADVLAGDISWLDRVGILIMEIHTKYVDESAILSALAGAGLRRIEGRGGPTTVFVRDKGVR